MKLKRQFQDQIKERQKTFYLTKIEHDKMAKMTMLVITTSMISFTENGGTKLEQKTTSPNQSLLSQEHTPSQLFQTLCA